VEIQSQHHKLHQQRLKIRRVKKINACFILRAREDKEVPGCSGSIGAMVFLMIKKEPFLDFMKKMRYRKRAM
jgi:hypothetical protein